MGNSLQDQLLKAGLVDGQRAKKAQAEKRKATKRTQKGRVPAASEQERRRGEQARAQKAEHDRELNRRRVEESKKREIASQVRQLIQDHRVKDAGGDVAYNFADSGKLKRVHVTPEVQKRLTSGKLAIARLGDRYELVPADTAEKILERDSAAVILWNRESSQDDQDDPYRDYQVPDDLMW